MARTNPDKAYGGYVNSRSKGGRKYPRLNLQSGDKKEQIFRVKMLPRLANDGKYPYHEFYMHYSCGPDQDQSFVCLNETYDQLKSNEKRCPICSHTRKITRNADDYTEKQVELAKKQSGKTRIMLAVYSLDDRKTIQMLEVSGQAFEEILEVCRDDETGKYLEVDYIKGDYAIQIRRKGSGFNSKYFYKLLQSPKWKLDPEDGENIKTSILLPETVIERLDAETLNQKMFGEFNTTGGVDDSPAPGGDGEGTARPPASSGALDDLDAMAGGEAPPATTPAAATPPARQRQAQTPPAQTQPSQAPAATPPAVDNVLDDLDAMSNA